MRHGLVSNAETLKTLETPISGKSAFYVMECKWVFWWLGTEGHDLWLDVPRMPHDVLGVLSWSLWLIYGWMLGLWVGVRHHSGQVACTQYSGRSDDWSLLLFPSPGAAFTFCAIMTCSPLPRVNLPRSLLSMDSKLPRGYDKSIIPP